MNNSSAKFWEHSTLTIRILVNLEFLAFFFLLAFQDMSFFMHIYIYIIKHHILVIYFKEYSFYDQLQNTIMINNGSIVIKLGLFSFSTLKSGYDDYGDQIREVFSSIVSQLFFQALLLIFIFQFGIGQYIILYIYNCMVMEI